MFTVSMPRGASRLVASLFAVAAIASLGACGTRPVEPSLPFKAIALIPVASPQSIYTENRMVPLPLIPVLIASSISNRGKSAEFSQRMDTARSKLGPRFTKMLMEELQAKGFVVHTLDDFPRSPTDPDDIDPQKLPTQDAVLHVYFSDVSMDSSRMSSDYVPRVNVDAMFYPQPAHPNRGQGFYYRYGTDANGEQPWSIPSAIKYRYPNFDVLISRADDVAESWDAGMREMARRLARDLPQAN